jgi:hypothetical protein
LQVRPYDEIRIKLFAFQAMAVQHETKPRTCRLFAIPGHQWKMFEKVPADLGLETHETRL